VVNLSLNHLQTLDSRSLLDDMDTENVVAVCNSGNRSARATQLLKQVGIDAENLRRSG
jgi:rhodanese-related sulfurtransferase